MNKTPISGQSFFENRDKYDMSVVSVENLEIQEIRCNCESIIETEKLNSVQKSL